MHRQWHARRLRRHGVWVWLVLGSATSSARTAHAGNFDTFYLGNEAALQGGASTASAQRGTALWYNPAGLARLEHGSIDASVTAFSLSLGDEVDLDSDVPGSEATRLRSMAFATVPASLSYTRRLSFGGVGLGLFLPDQETLFLRTRLRAPSDVEGRTRELSVDGYGREQDYYVGPALGFPLGSSVDLGFALFGNVRTSYTNLTLATRLDGVGGVVDLVTHQSEDEVAFGIQPVAGVQVRLGSLWRLGALLRLPTLRLYREAQTVEAGLSAADLGMGVQTEFQDDFGESSGLSSNVLTPLRVHVGVARQFGDAQLALDASYRAELTDAELGIDQRAVFNARLGGQLPVSDTLTLGAGLFSDRSAERLGEESDGRDLDYYGVSIAAQLDTVYGVVSRKGAQLEAPRPLVFRTTVALSYLHGIGKLERAQLRYVGGAPEFTVEQKEVVAHQMVLHVGATLLD